MLIGAQGHDIIGYTPRPNQSIAWSAQSFARGATALLFFRYRAAAFGQEEFCYGVLDHTTPVGTGRKWAEAKAIFALARNHAPLWLAPVVAKVALLYDPDSIFAWQAQPHSTAFDFTAEAARMHYGFWRHGVPIDVISTERTSGAAGRDSSRVADAMIDLSAYRILLLPAPMLVSDKLFSALSAFVQRGGSLWVGFRADLKDRPTNQMRRTSSRLAALAGVIVQEIESLNLPATVPLRAADAKRTANHTASAAVWRDGLRIAPGSNATAVWDYADADFFGGLRLHAVTHRRLASGGEVNYIGTGIEATALERLATSTLTLQRLGPGLGGEAAPPAQPVEVEELRRIDSSGQAWVVRINYASTAHRVPVAGGKEIILPPYGVSVLPEREGGDEAITSGK
eukprot:1810006-Prymnesium_polylepis.5